MDSSRTARKRAGSAGSGGTPPLSRHLIDARRRHLRHRPWPLVRPGAVPLAPGRAGLGGPGRHLRHLPWPPVRPGAVPTASGRSGPGGPVNTSATGPSPLCGRGGAPCAPPLLAGVGRCPLANGRGCLLGCPSARRIAGTRRHRCPRKGQQWGGARAGAAAGGSPSVPFRGLRACGAGPITGTSAGLECCVHQIASSVRLRRLGLLRVGRSLDTVPLGPRAVQVGRPSGRAVISGPSCPGHRTRTAGES